MLTSKQACTSQSDCYYCASDYFVDPDPLQITVSGAGSYVVTAEFGESEPGANDGTQAGTYSLNGTYTYQGYGTWNKDNCSNNDCFSIYRPGNGPLTIYGQGSAGFPAWSTNEGFVQGCPPFSISGWTKESYQTNGYTINDPAPTVTAVETTNRRSSCLNAGGVYFAGDILYDMRASCTFYSILPLGEDGTYCSTLAAPPNPSSSGIYFYDEGLWSYTNVGNCCSGSCIPPYYDTNTCTTSTSC